MLILPPETWAFVALIVVGMLIAHVRFTESSAHDTPGILITIGIFATFYGIAIGLYRFDINNIDTSLPQLISGIKLAFWASVVGVGAALTLKIRYAIFGVISTANFQTEGATIDDLVVHLKNSSDSIARLQQAMVGDEDSTLLTQLKLIRSDQNDKLDSLKRAFSDFAEKQAENNSKALIEALKEVIRDFNQKINEQFGDNFKQLNQAVGKINEWQEQYRLQMSEMIEQQKQTASDMNAAGKSFTQIVDDAKSFAIVAKELQLTIGTMSELEKSLQSNLKALAILVESARTGIPTIEKKVMEIITEVGNGAKASSEMISKQVAQSAKDMGDAVQKQNLDISRNIQEMSSQLHQQVALISSELTKVIQRHNEVIGNNLSELSKKTEQQVLALDAELASALKKSLDTLGQQLGALSTKFVQDYAPLTEKLQKVVEIASRIKV